ncbi:MAG: hypothetical protein RIR00_836 [Pseudomonadota bacterium]
MLRRLLFALFCCFPLSLWAHLAAPYQPLHPGDSWNGLKNGNSVQNDVAYYPVTLASGVVAKAIYSTEGETNYFTNDAAGLREHGGEFVSSGGNPGGTVSFSPAMLHLPAEFNLGTTTTTSGTVLFQFDGRPDASLQFTLKASPKTFESVTVPAGTFTALRLDEALTISGTLFGTPYLQSVTRSVWLVSGLGNVKSFSSSTVGGNTTTTNYALISSSVFQEDTTPDDFNFPTVTGALPGNITTSGQATLYGINTEVPISINGGEYQIEAEEWTSTPGFVKPYDRVRVRQTAPADWGKTSRIVLTVGTLSIPFDVSTLPAPPQGNFVYFEGTAEDYISQGTRQFSGTMTGDTMTTFPYGINTTRPEADFHVSGRANGNFSFRAPGEGRLQPGYYINAERAPFARSGRPGIDIGWGSHGCNRTSGTFTVHEVTYDADGHIQKFAADFEQHCEAGASFLRGVIRYNSSLSSELHGSPGLPFSPGWNLGGNSWSSPINVATTFNDASKILSVWKWLPASGQWAFYTPTQADGGAAYATQKGYAKLTSIAPGEGYWLRASTPFSLPVPAGNLLGSDTLGNLVTSGWTLATIGEHLTPRELNALLGPATANPIPQNVTSIWAWDNLSSNWYFYTPQLDAETGTTLADYSHSRGFLDYLKTGQTTRPGAGFWVNKP